MGYRIERFSAAALENGKIEITAAEPGDYMLYWSAKPDGFIDDNELGRFTEKIIVDNPLPARRCYFHIFGTKGEYGVAAPRVLIPDGRANLRDLGGYETADGTAFVRQGALYRAHTLFSLDAAGLELVERLELDVIVDFRTSVEIAHEPDPSIPGVEYINVSPMVVASAKNFAATLDDLKRLGPDGACAAGRSIVDSYRSSPFGNEAFRGFFRILLEERGPVLFHCAAGKDRTGIAAALVLTALGVPRETILFDYMLTNRTRVAHIENAVAELSAALGDEQEILRAIRAFVSVEESSLNATFAAIDQAYPDIEAYFTQELLVPAGGLETLRNRYLVPHTIQ